MTDRVELFCDVGTKIGQGRQGGPHQRRLAASSGPGKGRLQMEADGVDRDTARDGIILQIRSIEEGFHHVGGAFRQIQQVRKVFGGRGWMVARIMKRKQNPAPCAGKNLISGRQLCDQHLVRRLSRGALDAQKSARTAASASSAAKRLAAARSASSGRPFRSRPKPSPALAMRRTASFTNKACPSADKPTMPVGLLLTTHSSARLRTSLFKTRRLICSARVRCGVSRSRRATSSSAKRLPPAAGEQQPWQIDRARKTAGRQALHQFRAV
jgi:hypothetical protein